MGEQKIVGEDPRLEGLEFTRVKMFKAFSSQKNGDNIVLRELSISPREVTVSPQLKKAIFQGLEIPNRLTDAIDDLDPMYESIKQNKTARSAVVEVGQVIADFLLTDCVLETSPEGRVQYVHKDDAVRSNKIPVEKNQQAMIMLRQQIANILTRYEDTTTLYPDGEPDWLKNVAILTSQQSAQTAPLNPDRAPQKETAARE